MSTRAERHDGPTPNGGAYSIAYRHADGSMEIVEFDVSDREIHRTYSEAPDSVYLNLMINDDILVDEHGNEIPQPPDASI
jgi:hypothetical protein